MRILRVEKGESLDIRGLQGKDSTDETVRESVLEVVSQVRNGGDEALRELTKRFDRVDIENPRVSDAEISNAYGSVSTEFLAAIRETRDSVRRFHSAQIRDEPIVQTRPGVRAWRSWRPIDRVGLYVPGGTARYSSSVVMMAVPAALAGCDDIVLATPPDQQGGVPAQILVTAAECGVTEIYKMGGAQAIATLAYGTESIRKVRKIIGPGNAYVTAAKLEVFPHVAIDLPAGPSELLIIADETANEKWIAADLIANAEHGPDSLVMLLTTSRRVIERTLGEVERQIHSLPRRDIAAAALAAGVAVEVWDLQQASDISNRFAPEHLELMVEKPHDLLGGIDNAGSVFLGPWSSNAAGDYATGTNHVLPTGGFAAVFSPLSLEAFGRYMEVQELSEEGAEGLAPSAATIARSEGLEGHALALQARVTKRGGVALES